MAAPLTNELTGKVAVVLAQLDAIYEATGLSFSGVFWLEAEGNEVCKVNLDASADDKHYISGVDS